MTEFGRDYPRMKSLLDEISVVRQGMAARMDVERQVCRERAREALMVGNRRFWTEEMAESEARLEKERAGVDRPQSVSGSV